MVFLIQVPARSRGRLTKSLGLESEERFHGETRCASEPLEPKRNEEPSELLRELVAHLRQNRTQLAREWVVRITETRLLTR